jgi:hypothetical protein
VPWFSRQAKAAILGNVASFGVRYHTSISRNFNFFAQVFASRAPTTRGFQHSFILAFI